MSAISWLRSLGDAPALVVGDINCSIASTGIEGVLAMSGWTDLLADAGNTCYPSSGNPSRIDMVFANRGAR
eukprot:9194458-Lingulodinium_polyedra.AAC.1